MDVEWIVAVAKIGIWFFGIAALLALAGALYVIPKAIRRASREVSADQT